MFRGTVLDSFKAATAVIENTVVLFRGSLGMETATKLVILPLGPASCMNVNCDILLVL